MTLLELLLCEFWEIFRSAFKQNTWGKLLFKMKPATPFYIAIISSYLFRNSHPVSSEKKTFLEKFRKIRRKCIPWSPLLKNLRRPYTLTFTKTGLHNCCFRVDFAKFFRTSTLCTIAYNFLFLTFVTVAI